MRIFLRKERNTEYSLVDVNQQQRRIILESINKTGALITFISNYRQLPLKKNDIILAVNQENIKTVEDFLDKLHRKKNDQINILIERDGKKKKIITHVSSFQELLAVPKPPESPKSPDHS